MTTTKTSVILVLVSILLGAGGALWLGGRREAGMGTRIDTSRAAVVTEMRALGRLETASYTIEKVIEADKGSDSGWSKFLFGDKLLLIAHGDVIAGIDLSGLGADDLTTIDGKLHVRLPAPQILSASLDNSQTRVYDRTQGLLTRADQDLESEARAAAQQSIRDAACQSGILDSASENASKQVGALLGALGFQGAVVDIPPGSC